MADKKISELTAITGANSASDDVYVVVDTSTGETKKITRAELFKNTPALDVTGTATMDGLTVDGSSTLRKDSSDTTLSGAFATNDTLKLLNETDLTGNYTSIGFVGNADEVTARIASVAGVSNGRGNLEFYYGRTSDGAKLKGLQISEIGDISFYEDTGTTAKFFWDASAESLGIGTTTPASILHLRGAVPNLRIENTDGSGDLQITHTGSAYSYGGVGANQAFIYSNDDVSIMADTTHNIKFHTNTAERMRIDSAGNVDVSDGTIRVSAGSGSQYSARLGVSYTFPYVDTLLDSYAGASYDGRILFRTNSGGGAMQERARIDSSGNLLVGKTTADYTTAGAMAEANGTLSAVRNNKCLLLNRTTTDGAIAEFRKDGTTVGSIQSRSGVVSTLVLDPRTGGAGISGGGNVIYPTNNTGALSGSAIDIGSSSVPFKDLYLSGGVYVGGTGAANYLDDYETGTWTPAIGSGTATVGNATYTKIGNTVRICAYITNFSDTTSANTISITGLPFTPTSNTHAVCAPIYRYFNSNGYQVSMYLSTDIRLYSTPLTGGAAIVETHAGLTQSSAYFYFDFTYQTSA